MMIINNYEMFMVGYKFTKYTQRSNSIHVDIVQSKHIQRRVPLCQCIKEKRESHRVMPI